MNRRAFLTSTGVAATVVALPQNRSTAKNGDEMKRPMLNEKLGSRKGLPDLQPAPRRVLAGLEPYVPNPQQPWDRRRIEYLLRRTTFGAKREHVDLALTKTPGEIVDILLADQPAPTALSWVTEKPNYTNTQAGSEADQKRDNGRIAEFKRWWIGLMLDDSMSIREKMVLFWHDHFATEWDKVRVPQWQFILNTLFRENVFGNFKSLLRKVTTDPCMLYYLDNVYSTKQRPNENYARELQELFSLGIYDSNGQPNYTEADIQNAARALTGWRVASTVNGDVRTYELVSYLNQSIFDTTNKTFHGQTGNFGVDEIIDIIFTLPAAAEFICRKLYREFVYEAADETIVKQMAAILKQNNWEIKPVLAALFKSAHFFDDANIGAHIQNPFEFNVGISRSLGMKFTANADIDYLYSSAAGLGMQMLDPPNVKGWPAYRSWISSSLLPSRWGFSDNIIDGRNFTLKFNGLDFAKKFPDYRDAEKLVENIAEHMLTLKLSQNQFEILLDKLLASGPAIDWPNIVDTIPTRADSQIKTMMKSLLRLGENQLS